MYVSLADLLDRLSIVRLKRKHGVLCDEEHSLLEREIGVACERASLTCEAVVSYADDLQKINERIWDLESAIRLGKEGQLGLEEVGRRALAIRDLNRERIEVKNRLVRLSGQGFVEMKIDHASGA